MAPTCVTAAESERQSAKKFNELLTATGIPEPGRPAAVGEGRPRERRKRALEERLDGEPFPAAVRAGPRPAALPEAPPASAPPPDLDAIAQRVLAAASIASQAGAVSVRLELATPRLAGVSVELRLERGTLSARFEARDRGAARLLEGLLPALQTALQHRGVRVGAMDVARAAEGEARRAEHRRRSREGRRRRA